MRRFVAILLALSLLAGGVEAATDIGSIGQSNAGTAHETHGDFHEDGSDSSDTGDETSDHFCHCTAHSPAVIMSMGLPILAVSDTALFTVKCMHGAGQLPPPLRPPAHC